MPILLRALFAVLLVLTAVGAWAADITGQVTVSGVPIPGATVTATRDGQQARAITDESGTFRLMELTEGTCEPGFEPVRDAFAAGFSEGPELGASLAVVVDGEVVVDLWAGWCDRARTKPWEADTIVNVASTGKGFLATATHLLVERGALALDQPVADLWPSFAAAGKESITVAQLLDHTAGLVALREPLPLVAARRRSG